MAILKITGQRPLNFSKSEVLTRRILDKEGYLVHSPCFIRNYVRKVGNSYLSACFAIHVDIEWTLIRSFAWINIYLTYSTKHLIYLIPIFSFKKRIQSETVLVLLILYNIYHLYVQCYHEYIWLAISVKLI